MRWLPSNADGGGGTGAGRGDAPRRPRPSLYRRFVDWLRRDAQEAKEAAKEAYTFVRTHNWKQTARLAFQRKYWGWWFLLLVLIVASSVLSSYHEKLALAIRPYRLQIRDNRASWLIPTALLIIVSFPPLFGHELIILVVGLIWGILRGFAIACLGTFVGELATYGAFKYLFRSRAAALETKNVTYACLAVLMREGGWKMVTLVRFSAVPGHVTTAIQSTIGIGVWIFAVACFISLPKQFALVYLGVLLGSTKEGNKLPDPDPGVPVEDQGPADSYASKHRMISLVVFFVTGAASVIAVYIIWIRMRRLRPRVEASINAKRLSAEGGLSRVPTMANGDPRRGSVYLGPPAPDGPGGDSAISLAEEGSAPSTPALGPVNGSGSPSKPKKLGSGPPSAVNSSLTLPRYSLVPRSRSGTVSTYDTAAPSYTSTMRDRSDTVTSKRSLLGTHPLNSPSLPHLPYRDDDGSTTPREERRTPMAEPAVVETDYFAPRRRRSEPNVAEWEVEEHARSGDLPEILIEEEDDPDVATPTGPSRLPPPAASTSDGPR